MTDHDSRWKRSLAAAIRDGATLLRELSLSPSDVRLSPEAAEAFPCLVPISYIERMQLGNPRDPLLLQVLPVEEELATVPGFVTDAVDDQSARRAPGLIHKYEGRVLLIAAGSCAVNCRYCFRRHYPYQDEPKRIADWEPALAEIASDPTVHEVILSGGDPLMLPDERIAALLEKLEAIPHLTRLRVHSRLPIVLPDRVTRTLIDTLKDSRLQPIMVVHANHPAEVAGDCVDAIRELVRGGIPTLNQAVLLKDVNDTADTLAELSERLVNVGVMPYYLNQLDRVSGTAHFEVPPERGLAIMEELRSRLAGYALPRYVREVAGADAKLPVR